MHNVLTHSRNGTHSPRTGGEERRSVQRIVRNSTFNLLGQGLLAGSHLIVVVVLARALGKDGLGVCYTAFALVFAVQLLFEVGLHTLLTRRIAQGTGPWRQHVAEGAGLHAFIALASAAAFVIPGGAWAWWHADSSLALLAVSAGVACAAIQVQRFAAGVFRAFEQFGFENVTRALHGVVFLALVGVLAVAQVCSAATVLAVFAVSHVVAALVLLVGLQRRWHCLGWSLSPAVVRDWFREAIPLGLGDVVLFYSGFSDKYYKPFPEGRRSDAVQVRECGRVAVRGPRPFAGWRPRSASISWA